MATRPGKSTYLIATDENGNNVRLIIKSIEVDFLSSPQGKWEEASSSVSTESGEIVYQQEDGTYKTATGQIFKVLQNPK